MQLTKLFYELEIDYIRQFYTPSKRGNFNLERSLTLYRPLRRGNPEGEYHRIPPLLTNGLNFLWTLWTSLWFPFRIRKCTKLCTLMKSCFIL